MGPGICMQQTDSIILGCIVAFIAPEALGTDVPGILMKYLPYGSCLCMSLSPLDAVWQPGRADPVALLATHSARVKRGSP